MKGGIEIGKAVYVGYCPDSVVIGTAGHIRCTTATVIAGPFPPRTVVDGYAMWSNHPTWQISCECCGKPALASDYLLFPIDDPDTDTEATTDKAVTA